MQNKIAIIDYEMGNLKSVAKAIEKLGATPIVTRNKDQIAACHKLILPGVGAFADCMANLQKYDLVNVIQQQVQSGKDFLGICLGLQLLFDESEENGTTQGLCIIPGTVKKFDFGIQTDFKVPHMGWNQIQKKSNSPLFNEISNQTEFYFVHSYYVVPNDFSIIATTTDYGIEFCSSIAQDNIYACQFHPEKSQKNGLKVLQNFLNI